MAPKTIITNGGASSAVLPDPPLAATPAANAVPTYRPSDAVLAAVEAALPPSISAAEILVLNRREWGGPGEDSGAKQ